MEGDANSWIRRTKFSHTVCHRLDSAKLASIPLITQLDHFSSVNSRPGRDGILSVKSKSGDSVPLTIQLGHYSGANSRPGRDGIHSVKSKSGPSVQILQNPTTKKQRSVSPVPQTKLSDAFKEAQSDQKRFSTPHPRRKEPEKGIVSKMFPRDSRETWAPDMESVSRKSPMRPISALKIYDRMKSKKESWTKYFDHGGGRVTSVETADESTVDMSKLYFGPKFAHGAYSQLYQGIYRDESIAVKIIRVPDDDENGTLAARLENQFNREVTLLSHLHHQNVIKFVAACKEPPVFCIIAEYLSEGSLRSYLHKLEHCHKTLPLQKLVGIALDIARGMEYIHSQGIIHRDLKPENVLINQDLCMKIADFGIACEEAYCDLLADDPGTYRWMAPEMIKRKTYGRKVDVYSFGLILWEMIAGTIPYVDMTPIQAAFAVVNKNLRPVIPGDCPPAMRALIEQCWSLQPEKRPEFWQIVKVLEQFESSFAHDGTLALVQNPTCQDHKKGLLRWIQKLGPMQSSSSSTRKPRFA